MCNYFAAGRRIQIKLFTLPLEPLAGTQVDIYRHGRRIESKPLPKIAGMQVIFTGRDASLKYRSVP